MYVGTGRVAFDRQSSIDNFGTDVSHGPESIDEELWARSRARPGCRHV